MSAYKKIPIVGLHDPISGAVVGVLGGDGQEYLFPAITGPQTGFMDTSGSPGNVTNSGIRGKHAFAAGQASCSVTNPAVKTTSLVLAIMLQNDTTLTQIIRVQPGNGVFVVWGNAAATGTPTFGYMIVNN